MSKYPKTLGRIEAVWNKLGGEEGVDRFLRGEITVSESAPKWREENGVIYLTVTSNGLTGEQWIKRLEKKKINIGSYAKSMLLSNDFKPTNGITYEIAILLFEDNARVTYKIHAEAEKRNLAKPNAEVACLIRENFSDEEIEKMGFYWIVVMHEPIKISNGDHLLYMNFHGAKRLLCTCCDFSYHEWSHMIGFAFVLSQVSA